MIIVAPYRCAVQVYVDTETGEVRHVVVDDDSLAADVHGTWAVHEGNPEDLTEPVKERAREQILKADLFPAWQFGW